jgi:hypothetical protein
MRHAASAVSAGWEVRVHESAASASAVVRPGPAWSRAGHSQPAQRRYLIRRGIVAAEARAATVFRLGCSWSLHRGGSGEAVLMMELPRRHAAPLEVGPVPRRVTFERFVSSACAVSQTKRARAPYQSSILSQAGSLDSHNHRTGCFNLKFPLATTFYNDLIRP